MKGLREGGTSAQAIQLFFWTDSYKPGGIPGASEMTLEARMSTTESSPQQGPRDVFHSARPRAPPEADASSRPAGKLCRLHCTIFLDMHQE